MPAHDSVVLENLPDAIRQIALRQLGEVDGLSLKPEIATFAARGWELAARLDSGESEGHWKRLRKLKNQFVAKNARIAELSEEVARLKAMGEDHRRMRAEAALSAAREEAGELLTDLAHAIDRGADYGETWQELLFTLRSGADLKSKEMDLLIQQSRVLTVEQAMWLVSQVLETIRENVADPETRERIGAGVGKALESAMTGGATKIVEGATSKGKRRS